MRVYINNSLFFFVILLQIYGSISLNAQTQSKISTDQLADLYNQSQNYLSKGNFEVAEFLKLKVYNESKDFDDINIFAAQCAFEIAQIRSTVYNDLDGYIKWLKNSDICNPIFAAGRLGDAYMTGTDGVEKNYYKAKYYYDRANDSRSNWIIATMYSENGELGQNDSQYLKYANRAVEKGSPQAQFYLGLEYYYGNLVNRDRAKGLYLIKKAAEQNFIKAIRFLESENIK